MTGNYARIPYRCVECQAISPKAYGCVDCGAEGCDLCMAKDANGELVCGECIERRVKEQAEEGERPEPECECVQVDADLSVQFTGRANDRDTPLPELRARVHSYE